MKTDSIKKFQRNVARSKERFSKESKKLLVSLEKKRLVKIRKDLGI